MAEDVGPSVGKLRVKIVSQIQVELDTEADAVQVPTSDGVRVFIPGRAPMICALGAGEIVLLNNNKPQERFSIQNGICEIRRDICAILASSVASPVK